MLDCRLGSTGGAPQPVCALDATSDSAARHGAVRRADADASCMAVRRTKPRSNRKPPEQRYLPDGDDGPARFADTSEIRFDFSTERPASPKRAIQRASRPTAAPAQDSRQGPGGIGSDPAPQPPEPPKRRKTKSAAKDPRPTPAGEVPRVDITAAAESLRASRGDGDGDGADALGAST